MNTINPTPSMNGMGNYPTTPPTTPSIQPSQQPTQTGYTNPTSNPSSTKPMMNGYPTAPMPQTNYSANSEVQKPTIPPAHPTANGGYGGQPTSSTQPSQTTNQPHHQQPTQANYTMNSGVQQQAGSQQMAHSNQQVTPPTHNGGYSGQTTPPVQQPQTTTPMNNHQQSQVTTNQWQTNQSNQSLSNGKQILRIDGKDAFVEIMDTKFHEGKITFHFSSYDKTKPAGQRQKDFIKFNLTFKEFMNLGHDVLYGNMMNWQPIDQYNNLRPAYMKGVPSKYNNNQAIARKLEVKNGDRQPIRLICSEGQGKETGQGLIQMVGQAQKRVQIGMSQDEFRSIFLVVPMYIQAYLTNHYDKCVK